nr:neutral/alkaline non-lysosomal ceramidase N-terminal domain-containing protein [Devosia sp. 919]
MENVQLPWTGTHDPVYARAMVINNGETEVAMVTMDVGGVPVAADLTAMIAEKTGIAPEGIWLAATHNHSMPSVGRAPGGIADQASDPASKAMLDKILAGAVEAVVQAKADLQDARMGHGAGQAYVNVNRDEFIDDRYVIGYNPEGPSNKRVDVLKFESVETGEPIAFLVNYAVHSVVMLTAVTKDGGSEVTSDLAGWTSNFVETHYDDKPVALWTMGAAGDQNPLFMALYNQSNEGRVKPGSTDLGTGGWALLHAQSARLAEEVIRVSEKTEADTTEVAIGAGVATAVCPGGKVIMDPKTAAVTNEDAPDVELRLQAITLNDVALTGVNGEVNTVIGDRFMEQSPAQETILITHTAGSIGYIPDDESYPKTTFEVTSSRMKPGCAEPAIIEGLAQLITSVSSKP